MILAVVFVAAGFVRAKEEPFFDGLGSYKHKITTESPSAQRYFNQGLAFDAFGNRSKLVKDSATMNF